ncbi:MAG: 4-hydroxy-tetrahydrodipicolinate reductase [Deltaproteobacteria bacterium]|nr:4-hydroxy-tetrahydrodipicolinate reductase [Deltaproteobacteria bacterium]
MIKVLVTGAAGRMGRRIISLLLHEDDMEVVAATEVGGHPCIGKDVGEIIGLGKLDVLVSDNLDKAASKADVVVDFTNPQATLDAARHASMEGKPMVIGTTGFSSEERVTLEELAKRFPCVVSPNMSIGVNIMFEITRKLAELLGNEFDVEIIEAHHRQKRDSPSGTAIRLGEIIAESTGRDFSKVARFERHGHVGERGLNEIGIQAIRGGDIIGEHSVLFCGNGERVELTHRATNRDNFARGAIRALRWIIGKPPGIYTMRDVLGI